ncbi:hypothetical protein GCM10010917_42720 [Paenibacillus physcomitrellae]|uniref:Uncharacterized protein n=1 Tax=Paenibacillus physcomitrellae TaxID=1619311 RepID=A0ABQ1GZD6_9BACL|nr:hypothetical protein GCM10010917_42720 [Paenibacillus physcomitrellae]
MIFQLTKKALIGYNQYLMQAESLKIGDFGQGYMVEYDKEIIEMGTESNARQSGCGHYPNKL